MSRSDGREPATSQLTAIRKGLWDSAKLWMHQSMWVSSHSLPIRPRCCQSSASYISDDSQTAAELRQLGASYFVSLKFARPRPCEAKRDGALPVLAGAVTVSLALPPNAWYSSRDPSGSTVRSCSLGKFEAWVAFLGRSGLRSAPSCRGRAKSAALLGSVQGAARCQSAAHRSSSLHSGKELMSLRSSSFGTTLANCNIEFRLVSSL